MHTSRPSLATTITRTRLSNRVNGNAAAVWTAVLDDLTLALLLQIVPRLAVHPRWRRTLRGIPQGSRRD